jgi:pyruvate dehydrogenase E1 component alpha subunit
LNFGAVFKTATVFFCVNNQWAISTPVSRQMATKTIAEKANAYGMPGVRVDGFDPLACWKATRDALDRGRNGEGPTLIEAYCYRLGPHGTADDPKLYRNESDTDEWKPLEPLSRTAGFLKRIGVLTDDKKLEIKEAAKQTIAEAVTEMEAIAQPSEEILFDHVYASGRPWTFDEGLAELHSVQRPPEVKPLGPPVSPGAGEEGKTQ